MAAVASSSTSVAVDVAPEDGKLELLSFQRSIVRDLLEHDGLTCLGKGLGTLDIIAALAHAYTRTSEQNSKLVLMLNLSPEDRQEIAKRHNVHLQVVDNAVSFVKRKEMYAAGGCICISARILIVDLLNKTVPITVINGLIVNRAHTVLASVNMDFILRVYREENPAGFVKALTDNAEAFNNGFYKIEKIMNSLYVKKLYLWPRFRLGVKKELFLRQTPNVFEVLQPLSASMVTIQKCLVEVMQGCIMELRNSCKDVLVKIRTKRTGAKDGSFDDDDTLSVRNVLSSSVHNYIKQQLDPHWHKISAHTKQVCSDLGVLSKCMEYLTTYDCVSFYRYLMIIRSIAQKNNALWIDLTATADLMYAAKNRVYHFHVDTALAATRVAADGKQTQKRGNPDSIELVLEPSPKATLMKAILKKCQAIAQDPTNTKEGRVLVVCRDRQNVNLARAYATAGEQLVLKRKWVTYIESERYDERELVLPTPRTGPDGKFAGTVQEVFARMTSEKTLLRLSLEELSKELKLTKPKQKKGKTKRKGGPAKPKRNGGDDKKRRVVKPVTTTALSETNIRQLQADPADLRALLPTLDDDAGEGEKAVVDGIPRDENTVVLVDRVDGLQIVFHDPSQLPLVLQQVQPEFIILLDPTTRAMREIEVYQATRPADVAAEKIDLYFLMYKNSVEQQRYMRSLKNERDCFEGLIDHKSRMVLNEDSRSSTAVASRPEPNTKSKQLYAALRKQAGDVDIGADDGEGLSYSEERISNSSSRSGGQKVVTRERIIVDIREFMSNLPAYLYSHDFELIPVTLLVGDFILSLYICIERKSLPDLIQSFASGRLYNQMMQMRRCYKQPVLMIEFSKDKRFFLQPVSDIRRQISSKDLISKLCLLMLHFPEMQVLWSRNPHHTAALFKMLKMNRSQPVLNNEYMAGLQDEDAAIAQQGEHDLNTMTPYDMLRKIPGVHDGNVRKLLNHIDTLQDLANATEQDMCTWLGNINGQACFRFVNEDVGTFFV